MKKLTILTSVLALAACGGGSGGSSGGSSIVTPTPIARMGTVTQNAIDSNAAVTGMVSEIGRATDGSTIDVDNVSRSATTRFTYNGKEYESYKLNDVNFIMADEGFGGEMTFGVDETTGEITSFVLLPDEEDPEDKGMTFERAGYDPNDAEKSKQFTGQVNHNGHQDAVLTYNSLGKDVGLKYSDFGGFDIDVIDGWRPTFAGGYDVKKIDTQDISNDVTFTGKATGSVVAVLGGEGSGVALPLDSNANLTFNKNSKTTTMTASFDNWYDVEYTKVGNDTGNVAFTNGKNEDFYLIGDTQGNGRTVSVTGEDVRYFGDNNIASEAAGIIQVRDCNGKTCDNDYDNTPEVRMNLSFGVK